MRVSSFAVLTCLAIPATSKQKAASQPQPPPVAVGELAPGLEAEAVDGKRFRLAAHVGEAPAEPRKALVLVFLDPREETCVRELNQLQQIDQEWRGEGVSVLHVGLRQGRKPLGRFVSLHAITWPVLVDRSGIAAKRYGVERAPHLVIVGSDGRIAFISTHYSIGRLDALRETLGKLVGKPIPNKKRHRSVFLSHDKQYQFGRPPAEAGAAIRWQPLAMHVGMMANAFISMRGADSYVEYLQSLRRGDYELANAGPLIARQVLDAYEPAVILERQGRATYRGIFFARQDSGIARLADLRGRVLALVSPHSSSGGAYPVAELLRARLELEVDVQLLWVGSHEAVARAVDKGLAAAGACYEDCRDSVWKDPETRDRETRVFGQTKEIPSELILVRRNLPPSDKAALKKALLSLDEQKAMLKRVTLHEEPLTGVSAVPPDTLVVLDKHLKGVAEAVAAADRLAREREERESDQE